MLFQSRTLSAPIVTYASDNCLSAFNSFAINRIILTMRMQHLWGLTAWRTFKFERAIVFTVSFATHRDIELQMLSMVITYTALLIQMSKTQPHSLHALPIANATTEHATAQNDTYT